MFTRAPNRHSDLLSSFHPQPYSALISIHSRPYSSSSPASVLHDPTQLNSSFSPLFAQPYHFSSFLFYYGLLILAHPSSSVIPHLSLLIPHHLSCLTHPCSSLLLYQASFILAHPSSSIMPHSSLLIASPLSWLNHPCSSLTRVWPK